MRAAAASARRHFSAYTPRGERLPLNPFFAIVPQQRAYVVERLGKFSRTLGPGFYPLLPFLDRIAYVHSLKETALSIPSQAAITRDNVTITIDGVLYVRFVEPWGRAERRLACSFGAPVN